MQTLIIKRVINLKGLINRRKQWMRATEIKGKRKRRKKDIKKRKMKEAARKNVRCGTGLP